jgi:hypothetical protein
MPYSLLVDKPLLQAEAPDRCKLRVPVHRQGPTVEEDPQQICVRIYLKEPSQSITKLAMCSTPFGLRCCSSTSHSFSSLSRNGARVLESVLVEWEEAHDLANFGLQLLMLRRRSPLVRHRPWWQQPLHREVFVLCFLHDRRPPIRHHAYRRGIRNDFSFFSPSFSLSLLKHDGGGEG